MSKNIQYNLITRIKAMYIAYMNEDKSNAWCLIFLYIGMKISWFEFESKYN